MRLTNRHIRWVRKFFDFSGWWEIGIWRKWKYFALHFNIILHWFLYNELTARAQFWTECSWVQWSRIQVKQHWHWVWIRYLLPASLNLQPTIGSRDSVQYSTVYGAAVERGLTELKIVIAWQIPTTNLLRAGTLSGSCCCLPTLPPCPPIQFCQWLLTLWALSLL